MWLTSAFIGYTCLALVAILDKFILSKEKVLPSVFVFYSTIFLLPLNLAIFWLPTGLTPALYSFVILAALTFSAGLFSMYRAFEKSEVSHMGPFIGGLIPLFILILGQIFLHELISSKQVVGIIFISIGTIIISIQKNMGRVWLKGVEWALVAALAFSVSHVASKFVYSSLGFGSGFVYIWGFMGFIGVALFGFSPIIRRTIFPHRNFLTIVSEKFSLHRSRPKYQAVIIVADKVLSGLGMVFIQYAVSVGSVTKVYALSGIQYALLVIMIMLLTVFYPGTFSEKYAKGEMGREFMAVLIIALGLAFLVK